MLYKAPPPATWPIKRSIILLLISGLVAMPSHGRDDASSRPVGHAVSRLWLPYAPVTRELRKDYSAVTGSIYCPGNSPILTNARDELLAAIEKLTGTKVELSDSAETRGGLLLGTIAELHAHLPEALAENAESLKDDGYVIESMRLGGKEATVITSKTHRGVLYGVFHFIRLMQTGKSIACLQIAEEPAVDLRMLNHWDNLSGSIERGYAGKSLWRWDELPDTIDPRYRQYARFCASIGINGVALNNVNADPRILRDDYLEKVSALADGFREWGIKTYVCPNYASPMSPSETPDRFLQWGGVGNLDTADPMDLRVQEWWNNKVTEIYKRIPDFGGFLVKRIPKGCPGQKPTTEAISMAPTCLRTLSAPMGAF